MQKRIAVLLLILGISMFSSTVHAQTVVDIEASPASEATVSSEYKLPYPGMLPDHPLYKLKTLRDKIILFLIRDPYKKTTKHLQLADKQLFAALKVAEKGNISLATHTAFKGEHNMTLLVNRFKDAVYSGKEFNIDLANKAHQAAKKHQELLVGMKSRAKGKEREAFDTIMEFSKRNDNELFKLERESTAPQETQ